MLIRITLSALAGIGLTATMVSAETAASSLVDGTLHFSVGAGTIGNDIMDYDGRSLKLSFEGNVNLSEHFKIGIDFSHTKWTVSDVTDIDIESTRFNVTPTYSFGSGTYAGIYLQDFSMDFLGAIPLDLESYGALIGYANDEFSIEGYAGKTTLDLYGMQGGSMSADNFGVIGTLTPTENLKIFAHYSLANINDTGMSGDVSIAAIGAEYGFGNGLSMFGAFSSAEMDDGTDALRQASIGVSYDLAQSGMPGAISFDWTRTDYGSDGVNQNMFSLGWTIPLGGAAAAPQTCTMNNARGKNRAALAATFECSPAFVGAPS